MDKLESEELKFEIKTHDFEENVNHLKVFSEQEESDLELKKVNGSKDIGEWFTEWFKGGGIGKDHKVTGDELNEVTTQIQNNLIVLNKNQREIKKEFGTVYAALSALDRDYMSCIIVSQEEIRKTNKKLKESQEVIKTNQTKIEQANDDIRKSHRTLQKTVLQLQRFKEMLDKYKHLEDIDNMWNDIVEIEQTIKEMSISVDELIEKLNTQVRNLSVLKDNQDKMLKQSHIYDIDIMWKSNNSVKENVDLLFSQIKEITSSLESSETNIVQLLQKKRELDDIIHLVDIDEMFETNQRYGSEIKILQDCNSKQTSMLVELREEIEQKERKIAELEVAFSSKLKTVYMLMGGTIGLVVIELIVMLTKVM